MSFITIAQMPCLIGKHKTSVTDVFHVPHSSIPYHINSPLNRSCVIMLQS